MKLATHVLIFAGGAVLGLLIWALVLLVREAF